MEKNEMNKALLFYHEGLGLGIKFSSNLGGTMALCGLVVIGFA
jgi:hypothetical protein